MLNRSAGPDTHITLHIDRLLPWLLSTCIQTNGLLKIKDGGNTRPILTKAGWAWHRKTIHMTSQSQFNDAYSMQSWLFVHVLFREGSVVVELVATLMRHPYAEGIFNASFMALDLDSLFPWEVTHYLNRDCEWLACLS